jgi:sulfite exporter TauE/SafE
MWILVSAVLMASFMGSLHCVGMCGPLALWAAGADQRHSAAQMALPTTLYHLGRLATYALVGLLAGSIGQALDWSGDALGVQLLAARIVGIAMMLVGAVAVGRILRPWLQQAWTQLRSRWSQKSPSDPSSLRSAAAGPLPPAGGAGPRAGKAYVPPQPNWITRQLIRLRPRLFGLPLPVRGLTIGLLTALLPCGWLYLFALLAAGTGGALSGAILMAAFWLGSVPALVSLVAGSRLLTKPLRRAVPLAASLLLIAAGGYTAAGRGMAELSGKLKVTSSLVERLQAGQSVGDLTASDIDDGMQQLVSTPLPCCQARAAAVDGASEASVEADP